MCQFRKILAFCFTVILPFLTHGQNSTNVSEMIATYKYPVQYLSINSETEVAYIDEGQGDQTLVFIHGLATYIPSWYPMVDHFRSQYRCIAIDLPGYGRSSKGDYPATMSYYAGVVGQLIDSLGLENVVLVGHSMGAQVAVTTVLDFPNQFEKLILLAPAGFETFSPEHASLLKATAVTETFLNATEAQIRASWAMNFYQMPESVEFMIQDRINMMEASDFERYCQSVARGVHGMLDQPIADRLGEIRQKTLVVYGEEDALIPNRYLNPGLTTKKVAESGASKIPEAVLKYVPACGHFISFDKPAEINEIVDSFLTN